MVVKKTLCQLFSLPNGTIFGVKTVYAKLQVIIEDLLYRLPLCPEQIPQGGMKNMNRKNQAIQWDAIEKKY